MEENNEKMQNKILELEQRIHKLETGKNTYGFSRFVVDLMTGFLVVSAVIFWIALVFIIMNRVS